MFFILISVNWYCFRPSFVFFCPFLSVFCPNHRYRQWLFFGIIFVRYFYSISLVMLFICYIKIYPFTVSLKFHMFSHGIIFQCFSKTFFFSFNRTRNGHVFVGYFSARRVSTYIHLFIRKYLYDIRL